MGQLKQSVQVWNHRAVIQRMILMQMLIKIRTKKPQRILIKDTVSQQMGIERVVDIQA